MTSWQLPPSAQRAILAEYKAGTPLKVIAARFRVSLSYPGRLAKRRGIVLRRAGEAEQ